MGVDPDAGQVRMPPQSVAGFTGRHGLGAGGAFGAARSQVQNGLSPMASPLLYQGVYRVNLHPLRTPAEGAVGGRVAASYNVHPKGFFHERLQQVGVNVQAVLLGALPHAVQRACNHFGNGGNRKNGRQNTVDGRRDGKYSRQYTVDVTANLLGGDGQYNI